MLNDDAGDTTDLLLIAGVDHAPAANIYLMPNLYVQLPDGPDPNVQARMTVYYTFRSGRAAPPGTPGRVNGRGRGRAPRAEGMARE